MRYFGGVFGRLGDIKLSFREIFGHFGDIGDDFGTFQNDWRHFEGPGRHFEAISEGVFLRILEFPEGIFWDFGVS